MEKEVKTKSYAISVAPMMDWTDRHCRFFLRLIAPHVRLYTEMVTTGALLHGDAPRHLDFNPSEHPVVLQLGGNDPAALATSAKMGADWGYDEINLNCGCPSDRVQNGAFGACLMKEPDRVADCIAAMRNAVSIPVTVKCRIGVDDCVEEEFLPRFIDAVAATGCDTFIIHARKAWLKGLSPKENREVPPLRYDIAASIKQSRPHLNIVLNGGIKTVDQIRDVKPQFDGVMVGREAYQNPYSLAAIESAFFNHTSPGRADIAQAMIAYMEQQARDHGTPAKSITRHILGLYQGEYGGKGWRRALSTLPFQSGITPRMMIETALQQVQDRQAA